VEPLLFNGKLISIKLKIKINDVQGTDNELTKWNGKTIIFKDSYLLIPVSLRKLALTYNCTKNKGIFPYNLNDIFYSGSFPSFDLFTDISIIEYTNMSSNAPGWGSLRLPSIKKSLIRYTSHNIVPKNSKIGIFSHPAD